MLTSAWFRFGLLLAAVGMFTAATKPAMGSEPIAYGQRLVAQYRLPPDTIARYAAMAAGTSLTAAPREDSMFADPSPWVGPKQRAGAGHNPYTVVFTVSGAAKAAGDVYAQWQAGWEVHESPVASRDVLMVVPALARTGVVAGQALTLTASSGRVSFRGERSVAPMLGLVQARNLDISDVQVQVWSGAAPQSFAVLPWSRAALVALGVTCLLVGLGFKYWQPVVVEPDVQPVLSLEPLRLSYAGPTVIECVEVTPAQETSVPVPDPAAPSHEARVVAALYQVLNFGLTVDTVLDEARMQRRLTAP
jgi:hypothetical protein